jgi:acyl-CoA hydrolase
MGSAFSAPTGHNLASLQRGQQFGLQMQRHVADLVEKQRAAGRRAQQADPIRFGVGESPAAVAEELAFEELRRECTEIHPQEDFFEAP